jgi:hypothetical protein
LFKSALPNQACSALKKMEVISDVKTLPSKYYYFGHWPFHIFQYSFFFSTTVWYSCGIYSLNMMVRLRKRWDIEVLIFAMTWSLFLLHIQVGCYVLAAGFRLMHTKFTHCLELSGGEKRNREKRWRKVRC